MMSSDAIAHLEQLLVGATCSAVEEHADRVLLVFGRVGLFLWCPWRLIRGNALAIGSSEAAAAVGRLSQILPGEAATMVRVSGPFHDLQVHFKSGLVLEAFPSSSEGESWQVAAGPNDMVVAGPTNLWSDFAA